MRTRAARESPHNAIFADRRSPLDRGVVLVLVDLLAEFVLLAIEFFLF
jgi:hypothetical protein